MDTLRTVQISKDNDFVLLLPETPKAKDVDRVLVFDFFERNKRIAFPIEFMFWPRAIKDTIILENEFQQLAYIRVSNDFEDERWEAVDLVTHLRLRDIFGEDCYDYRNGAWELDGLLDYLEENTFFRAILHILRKNKPSETEFKILAQKYRLNLNLIHKNVYDGLSVRARAITDNNDTTSPMLIGLPVSFIEIISDDCYGEQTVAIQITHKDQKITKFILNPEYESLNQWFFKYNHESDDVIIVGADVVITNLTNMIMASSDYEDKTSLIGRLSKDEITTRVEAVINAIPSIVTNMKIRNKKKDQTVE